MQNLFELIQSWTDCSSGFPAGWHRIIGVLINLVIIGHNVSTIEESWGLEVLEYDRSDGNEVVSDAVCGEAEY